MQTKNMKEKDKEPNLSSRTPVQLSDNSFIIPKTDKMNVPGKVFLSQTMMETMLSEVQDFVDSKETGFIPALNQIANVATLPGIVGHSVGLPDMHAGYGFAIGHVAAFDLDDPESVVSPGGVGFDINCGVRMLRTNLHVKDFEPKKEQVADLLFSKIPAGVGTTGVKVDHSQLKSILLNGIQWAISQGYAWPRDAEFCEEQGKIPNAEPKYVSERAKGRGLSQLGTLGSGNHYCEIQVVDEIYDNEAAKAMGLFPGQICIMIHSGSRGLGHQVASDTVKELDNQMNSNIVDRQLAYAKINSKEGKEYLGAMAAAANYAFVNRSIMAKLVRDSFSEIFKKSAQDLDMQLVYDVCHNIAKMEEHVVNGEKKRLLVHRKGATRAFPPHHPNIPKAYKDIGQPALVGGSMGTFSFVLIGTEKGMNETFGSTCHGAGRALARNQARKALDSEQVLDYLKSKGIIVKVSSPKLINEEAPDSYKDVCQVVDVCHEAGISKKVIRLRPICVIKG